MTAKKPDNKGQFRSYHVRVLPADRFLALIALCKRLASWLAVYH